MGAWRSSHCLISLRALAVVGRGKGTVSSSARWAACVLISTFAAVGLSSGVASAAPLVGFKARVVPIQGFAHTGNIYGAGAAVDVHFDISGTEFGGVPPPLIGFKLSLPRGSTINPTGFPTCAKSNFEASGKGPTACPKGSAAGTLGKVVMKVAFGGERVTENAELYSYHAPDGGLEFFISGYTPESLEILSSGDYISGPARFGPTLSAEMPLIAPAPGALDLSIESIQLAVGGAISLGANTVYYLTMPNVGECRAGFAFQAELTFAGLGGLTQTTVSHQYRTSCPREQSEVAPPQTTVPGTGGIVTAPSNTRCLSRRDFPIHIQQIKGRGYRHAIIEVNGHRVAVIRAGRLKAQVDLRGLPKGRYTVTIKVLTTSGRTLTGTRAYHTCARKPLRGGRPRL